MQTMLRILERAGGYRPSLYLRIENPPYMALVIEATPEPGPPGLPAISVAHYGEQNGDLMRDPEMCFEFLKLKTGQHDLDPFYWRSDYRAVEQWSRHIVKGHYAVSLDLHRMHRLFAEVWDENLRSQGFPPAFIAHGAEPSTRAIPSNPISRRSLIGALSELLRRIESSNRLWMCSTRAEILQSD